MAELGPAESNAATSAPTSTAPGSTSTTFGSKASGSPPPLGRKTLFVSSLVAFPLAATFLNLSSATLRRAGGLSSLDHILLALAGTLATLLLIHLALWCLSGLAHLVLRRKAGKRLPLVPLVVWNGLTVSLIALLSPVWDLVSENLPTGGWTPAERFMIFGVVWSGVVLVPAVAYRLARGRRHARMDRLARGALLAAPVLGFLTLLLTWAEVHWVSGLFSPTSILLLVLYVALVAATLGIATWLVRRVPKLPILLLVTLAVLGAPFVYRPPEHPDRAAGGKPDPTLPPCVLLLSVDTLRADMVPPFDDPSRRPAVAAGTSTPALEALARDSVVFLNARAPAPWTKPSTASMLTGLSPWVHGTGTLRGVLPPEVETLAERLRSAGYLTAGIGRNTFLRDAFNFDQGFDEYFFFPRGNAGILGARLLQRLVPKRFATEPSTTELTNFAVRWLRENHQERFFLWLHYFDPHGPFAPPTRYLPHETAAARIGTTFGDTPAIRTGELVPNLEEREWIRELYRSEVRYVSDNVGRVMETLEDFGLYDSCLIAFTSDHGEELWEHGGFEHGHTLYDEVLRVPLFLKLPGKSKTHQVLETAVSTESLTPTVLDLLGLTHPGDRFTAPSLTTLWQADPKPTTGPTFSNAVHYYEEKQSVVFGRFKYIREPMTGHEQLFDLEADPAETNDLAAEAPEALAQARHLLGERIAHTEILRLELGIAEDQADLDIDTLQDLRALGYIN